MGATRPEQLDDVVAAVDKTLERGLKARLDALTHEYRWGDDISVILEARELSSMKRTAHLINTSRGPIVDEEGYKIFYGHAPEDVKAWLAGQPVRVIKP